MVCDGGTEQFKVSSNNTGGYYQSIGHWTHKLCFYTKTEETIKASVKTSQLCLLRGPKWAAWK